MTLSKRGDKYIVEAVVVVVADGNAEPEQRNPKARLARDIGKGAVVIVVEELRRRRTALRMAGPVLAVNEQDVGIAVVIVVDERTARTHRLRQPFLAKGAVVVRETDPRLRCDVGEGDGLGIARRQQQQNHAPQSHRDTEERRVEFFCVTVRLCRRRSDRVDHQRPVPEPMPVTSVTWRGVRVRTAAPGFADQTGNGTDTCS